MWQRPKEELLELSMRPKSTTHSTHDGYQQDEEKGLVAHEANNIKKDRVEVGRPSYGSMAYMSLALLAVQNCSAVLIMRWTRATPGQNSYNTRTAVVMQEVSGVVPKNKRAVLGLGSQVFKTVASMGLTLWERGEIMSIFRNVTELLKTSVPAVLYLIQNNLQYVAVSNLHAATYQVTYQAKILSTALLSVCLLGRQLSRRKWAALIVLTLGVAAVQLSEMGDASRGGPKGDNVNAAVGLAATLLATLSSGCAGVYFEKILKSKSDLSLWQRNSQLGLYSVVIGVAAIFISPVDRADIAAKGFFAGYTKLTFVNLAVQSFGGLVIGKYIAQCLRFNHFCHRSRCYQIRRQHPQKLCN